MRAIINKFIEARAWLAVNGFKKQPRSKFWIDALGDTAEIKLNRKSEQAYIIFKNTP